MRQNLDDIRDITAMMLWDMRKSYCTKNVRKFRDAERCMHGLFMVGLISKRCYDRMCDMRYDLGL